MTDHNAGFLTRLPWRTGPSGRTIHAQFRSGATGTDPLVGVMDSPELAAEVCAAHNERLAVYPGAGDANRAIRTRLAAVELGDSPPAA